MEFQQTISKNINTIERQSSNTNSLFENRVNVTDNDKKSNFKDRLNDEIKQVKIKDKNIDKNQKDSALDQGVKASENKPVENKNDEANIVDKSNTNDIREKPTKNKIMEPKKIEITDNEISIDETENDLNGEILPLLEGSDLPLYNPEAQLDNSSIVLSDENAIKNTLLPVNLVQEVDIQLEKNVKQQVDTSNQKQVTVNQDIPLILADSRSVKPLKVTTQVSEKIQIQDTVFNKLMSEMPTGEAIIQSARLQQVPSVTAVANNGITTQNTALNPLLEAGITNNASQSGKIFSAAIATNIQSPNWSQQLTQQVSYMVKGGIQQAEIKLNPANLGPMEIKLSLQDDQASVQFVTQHVVVRDALDAAIPKLKDMLEQQGLNLSDFNVSTQSEQQSREDGQSRSEVSMDSLSKNSDETDMLNETVIKTAVSSGLSIFA